MSESMWVTASLLSGEWCLFILSNLGCKWISSCSWRQIYRPRLPGPQSELKGRKLPLQPHRTWLGDDLSRGSNLPPGESLPGSTWPFLPRVGGYREPGSVGCMPRNPVLALVLRVWASHFIRSGRESRPDCPWACSQDPQCVALPAPRFPESVHLASPCPAPSSGEADSQEGILLSTEYRSLEMFIPSCLSCCCFHICYSMLGFCF